MGEWRVTLLQGKAEVHLTVKARTQGEAIMLAATKRPDCVVIAAASAPLNSRNKVRLSRWRARLKKDGTDIGDQVDAETKSDAIQLFQNRNPGWMVSSLING